MTCSDNCGLQLGKSGAFSPNPTGDQSGFNCTFLLTSRVDFISCVFRYLSAWCFLIMKTCGGCEVTPRNHTLEKLTFKNSRLLKFGFVELECDRFLNFDLQSASCFPFSVRHDNKLKNFPPSVQSESWQIELWVRMKCR